MQAKTILITFMLIFVMILSNSIIFILVNPPFSYAFFFLFLLLEILVTIGIMHKRLRLNILFRIKAETFLLFLTLASIIFAILQIINVYVEALNAILYLFVFILTPGISILFICKLKSYFSCIELLALAYPLSIAFVAILGTFMFFIPVSERGQMELMTIILLSLVALIVERKAVRSEGKVLRELIMDNGALIFSATLMIYTFIYLILYPQISYLLGLDIVDNFIGALAFTRDPLGVFSNPSSLYPLFNIYQSSIVYTVGHSLEIFQILSITQNIFGILVFYSMASQYLKQYGDHTPAIATLIWGLFSGLGWLNFLQNKLTNLNEPTIMLIGRADRFSYGDITWRRLFFYLSMEASITLVLAILYFVRRNDLSRAKQIFLISILTIPLPLLHGYATYLLLPVLFCLTIFCRNRLRSQLNSTGKSLIIAPFSYLLLNGILQVKGLDISVSILRFSEYLILGLFMVFVTTAGKQYINLKNLTAKKMLKTEYAYFALSLLACFYLASILLWFSGDVSFAFRDLNRFGYVPWFLYPVKLGLIGTLTIVTVCLLITKPNYRQRELLAFLTAGLLLVAFSRIMATLQMQYCSTFTFYPNSWLSETIRQNILSFREERMFELFKIPLAVVASLAFGDFLITKTKEKALFVKYFLTGGIVSLILISGAASTLLGFTYYYDAIQSNALNSSELNALLGLQADLYANGKAIIITTQTPTSYLDFTGATAIVTESEAAWSSKSPELPIFVTRYSKTTPTYIYLHKIRDYRKLSGFSGNYLEHISIIAPVYLENQDVQVKVINNWSIPVPQSSSVLVIPYDVKKMTISQPFYQEAYKKYTELALFFEEKKQFMSIYQEPIIYANIEITEGMATFNGLNSYIRANGANMNFNKILIEFEFQPLDTTKNQVIVGKFDWGQPSQKSWEIAQYGECLAFKISTDGTTEIVLSTPKMLTQGQRYNVKCVYDGKYMKILIDGSLVASRLFSGDIFKSNVDLTIGCDLYNNKPTTFAKMALNYIQILNDVPAIAESQIFYAYDLLSAMGFNYTTILSIDNKLKKYKTLILPYDDFLTFEIFESLKNSQCENLIEYVVILNTNGYGPLLNYFGKLTNTTFIADSINFSDNRFPISTSIIVPTVQLNNASQVIASYTNGLYSSPMIISAKQNQLTLVYINIFPIVEKNQLNMTTLSSILKKELKNYFESYDENIITSWFTEPSLLFTRIQANGTITISSDAISLITTYENQMTYSSNNYKISHVECRQLTIEGGYGFYSIIMVTDPILILQDDANTRIGISGNITFLARQPKIKVSGSIQFKDFYVLHPPTIHTDGRTTSLSGNITLGIYVSDKYTIALPYMFNSPITVKYEKPLMEFDETLSFLKSIPVLIIALILLSTFYLISRHHYYEYPNQ